MKPLFKLREFAWAIVSEVEDWLYPYRVDPDSYLEDDEQPVDEVVYLKAQMNSNNDRIDRLQSEMLYVTSQINDINIILSQRVDEGQEGSKTIVEEGKETS